MKNRTREALSYLKKHLYLMLYYMFSFLPIQKKVVLASYTVDSVNLKSIKSALSYENVKTIEIYGNNKKTAELFMMAYHFATASCIVIDSYYRHLYDIKHRQSTKFVQVWHAAGIFKNFALLAEGKNQTNTLEYEQKAHKYYTHVIVSGDNIIEPYARAFGVPKDRVRALGVPRTDMFFDASNKFTIPNKVYNRIPDIKGKKVILYAPTFRGDVSQRNRFNNCLEFIRFKDLFHAGYVLLCKLHPSVQEPLLIPRDLKSFVFDVSRYEDINELFYVTDILITDYSSSIFEFALFHRPIIFFAYDLDKYINERGFYYDYEDFVPGPICKTTEEIVEQINSLEKLEVDHTHFIQTYLNRVDGSSTERVVQQVILTDN